MSVQKAWFTIEISLTNMNNVLGSSYKTLRELEKSLSEANKGLKEAHDKLHEMNSEIDHLLKIIRQVAFESVLKKVELFPPIV